LIARGDNVRTFCRGNYPALERLGVGQVRGDVRDRDAVIDACRGIDVVFHTAAVAGIWGPWSHYYGINTQGTFHVVDGCRKHGVSRLVFTSSPSVTFDGNDQCGIDESARYPEKWMCHYSHTKALAEQHVLQSNDNDQLLTCSLRPHLIWGPRDNHLIPRLIERAKSGRLRRVGDGTNLIDTVYVDNAATAHLQAADELRPNSPVAGSAYFISQGEPVNCWDWIDDILALAGIGPVEKSVSLAAATRAGSLCEAVFGLLRIKSEPPMTRFLARQLGTSHYFDIGRAESDFNYRPDVSTTEGMRRLSAELKYA